MLKLAITGEKMDLKCLSLTSVTLIKVTIKSDYKEIYPSFPVQAWKNAPLTYPQPPTRPSPVGMFYLTKESFLMQKGLLLSQLLGIKPHISRYLPVQLTK